MASILKKTVLALLLLSLLTSCALHMQLPFICFQKECVQNQWRGVNKLGHKIKFFGKQTIAKIHKKKHRPVPLESNIGIVKSHKNSLKTIKKNKENKISDSLLTQNNQAIQNMDFDTLSCRQQKNKLIINYPFNDDKISEKDKTEIKKYIERIDIKNISKIIVTGYIDNRESDAYNKSLSFQRAQRVYEYLIEIGVPSSKLSGAGKDSQNPLADNTTDEGAKINRRTEIEIY